MKIAQGQANAKLILIGEHSVVYGKSAIALPFFAAEITATIENAEQGIEILSDYFTGQLDQAPEILWGVRNLIENTLSYLELNNKGLMITLESNIPSQRGFGSSAAVSVALVRGLFRFVGKTINYDVLIKLVEDAEKIHHNNPSGLDSNAIISKEAIYFLKDQESLKINIAMDLDLIVGDTGIPASTKKAIQKVSHKRDKEKYIDQLGQLSIKVFQNIKDRDGISLGINMSAAHQALKKLGVSTGELDSLVDTAMTSGALGAKLSGGGLGGCMIALSPKDKTKRIVSELEEHGATMTWVLDLKEI